MVGRLRSREPGAADAADEVVTMSVAVPWTIATALVISSINSTGLLPSSPEVYVLAALALVVALIADHRGNGANYRLSGPGSVVAGMLSLWLLLLTFIAIDSASWAPNTFVITYGAAVLLVAVIVRSPAVRAPAASSGRPAQALVFGALLFALVSIIQGLDTIDGAWTQGLNHERMFIAVLCFTLPLGRHSMFVRVLVALAVAVSIFRYPSATTFVALLAAALTAMVLRGARRLWAVLALLLGVVAMLVALPIVNDLLRFFYATIGRVDNSSTRRHLWSQANRILADNPVLGGAMSEPITGMAHINGITQPVPFHNTLLTLGVAGGYVAMVLFGLLVLLLLGRGLFGSERNLGHAKLWVPSFVAAVVCISVNPVLEKLDTVLVFYALVVCGLLTVRPSERKQFWYSAK